MKSLVLLAIVLFVAKKAAEIVLTVFCVLLFGYGSYVLIRTQCLAPLHSLVPLQEQSR